VASDSENPKPSSGLRLWIELLLRFVGAIRLAVVLIVLLATVLAWATLLEAKYGREYAHWVVYHSRWFAALLGLLAANITAAALARFPWRKSQIGFVIAHGGLLLLLLGAIQTFLGGVEGELSLAEGATGDSIVTPSRSRVKLLRRGSDGTWTVDFSFEPGAVDWPEDRVLDFGEVDGLALKVLKFYRHARRHIEWVKAESGEGRPVIRIRLTDAQKKRIDEQWIPANPFGAPPLKSGITVTLHRAAMATLLDDFLKPPKLKPDTRGVLSIHFQDRMVRVPVDGNLGKTISIGQTGAKVEIVKYYANAMLRGSGQFISVGDEPRNPLLQLKVYPPGEQEPISEIVYAINPFVNYAALGRHKCPVKFWYHHPGLEVPNGAEFVQMPDEKLYCRLVHDGAYTVVGQVAKGEQIDLDDGIRLQVLEHIPRARQEISYEPIDPGTREASRAEAAALVELKVGDESHQLWLERNNPRSGLRQVESPEGRILLLFGYDRFPLGFRLKLVDFQRDTNPGGIGDASFRSRVEVIDEKNGVDYEYEIVMNRPLEYAGFRFYQSGFNQLPGEREVSVFTVSYDPGRFAKYLGSLMVCLGIVVMYCLKGSGSPKTRPGEFQRSVEPADCSKHDPRAADGAGSPPPACGEKEKP